MTRKKTVGKSTVKKLGKQNTVIVVKTIVSAKDTLFPEKLKKANDLLKRMKVINI